MLSLFSLRFRFFLLSTLSGCRIPTYIGMHTKTPRSVRRPHLRWPNWFAMDKSSQIVDIYYRITGVSQTSTELHSHVSICSTNTYSDRLETSTTNLDCYQSWSEFLLFVCLFIHSFVHMYRVITHSVTK